MNREDRQRYEMFGRVKEFGGKHGSKFTKTSIGGKAFATVTAAVVGIEHYTTAKARTSDDGQAAKARARKAIVEQLTDVARTARLVGRKVSGGAITSFKVPEWKSDVGLLTAARAVIGDGRAAADVLVQLGLPDTFVEDLETQVHHFLEADRGRQAGKLGLAAAQAGFTTAMAQAADAVTTLDVIVANTFKKDPMVLAEWERARHWKTRTKTSRPAEPAPPAVPPAGSAGETTAPAPPGNDGPAATGTPDPALRKAS